ncbi:MAG: putative RNA-binding protein YlqC (UPF0109 family) [Chlamydiales bacterium]|jgi:predicted RNA-binding protein YlqC (UPF0109 family)
MQQFVEYIVQNIVDTPTDVKVACFEGQRGTIIEVQVAKEDIGKVVGKNGRTIQALRTVAMIAGTKLGRHVRLELIE